MAREASPLKPVLPNSPAPSSMHTTSTRHPVERGRCFRLIGTLSPVPTRILTWALADELKHPVDGPGRERPETIADRLRSREYALRSGRGGNDQETCSHGLPLQLPTHCEKAECGVHDVMCRGRTRPSLIPLVASAGWMSARTFLVVRVLFG